MCWEVDNGATVRFWHDKWLDDGRTLVAKSIRPLTEEEGDIRVKDLVNEEGEWDLGKLGGWVNDEGKRLIMALSPPNDSHGEDVFRWGSKVQNQYVVSDMYHFLRDEQDMEEEVWNKVWRWKCPTRVQVFIWLAVHDRLFTSERKCRVLGGSPSCYKCVGVNESLVHVLRDCSAAYCCGMN